MLNVSSKRKPPDEDLPSALETAPQALEPSKARDAAYPWGVFSASMLVLAGFVFLPLVAQLILSLGAHVADWDSFWDESWREHSALATFMYVFIVEALTVGSVLGFTRVKKQNFIAMVGLRRPRWGDVGQALAGTFVYLVIFAVAIVVIGGLFPIETTKEQDIGFQRGIGGIDLAFAFVSLVVLPPLVEEILFRGFLFGTLRGRGVPLVGASLITSMLFGALHIFGSGDGSLLWIAFIDTFILSLVLCYAREKTGRIWSSIIIHALKNTLVFVNLFIINANPDQFGW